jgi:hypothetical protein
VTVASEIKEAVQDARDAGAQVSVGYEDEAIRAGKTVDQVKGELLDLMVTAGARAASRASMLKIAGMTSPGSAGVQEADRIAALPRSIAEAGGDARAFMQADIQRQAAAGEGVKPTNLGRANMEALVRSMGMQPKGSGHG